MEEGLDGEVVLKREVGNDFAEMRYRRYEAVTPLNWGWLRKAINRSSR